MNGHRQLVDVLATATVFDLPLRHRFRGLERRDGVLLSGPAGWGEFAPFHEYSDQQCVPWLQSALEAAALGWPSPRRQLVPVNVTIPVVDPPTAAMLVRDSGCRTAKVKVAAAPGPAALAADCARVASVRVALGPDGRIRVDANGAWSVPEAIAAISALDEAAAGLEYVEQPCATIAELAAVRLAVRVPIAADESIRLAGDPERVALAGAADIAVLKVAPLGGVRRALRVAASTGLRVVVSSALDTVVGLSAGLALAGALPELELACGLGTGSLLAGHVSSSPLALVDGALRVPATAPDPDLRGDHLADPSCTNWWLARLRRVAALLPDSAV